MIRLIPRLLELLPRVRPQRVPPHLSLRVSPREEPRRSYYVSVETQRLSPRARQSPPSACLGFLIVLIFLVVFDEVAIEEFLDGVGAVVDAAAEEEVGEEWAGFGEIGGHFWGLGRLGFEIWWKTGV